MSIFSPIISGEESCHKIKENDRFLAFLEKKPIKSGHCLVLPKRETDFIFDLAPADLSDLVLFSQNVALAIRDAIPCKKVAVAVLGLEVRHAHIHLVPVDSAAELNFTANRLTFTDSEFEQVAQRIRAALPAR
ncbi:MAG: HIT family protein [Leptospirales bacterium]|nr:HIT family protein [Leptospirales bacterium]